MFYTYLCSVFYQQVRTRDECPRDLHRQRILSIAERFLTRNAHIRLHTAYCSAHVVACNLDLGTIGAPVGRDKLTPCAYAREAKQQNNTYPHITAGTVLHVGNSSTGFGDTRSTSFPICMLDGSRCRAASGLYMQFSGIRGRDDSHTTVLTPAR